MTENPAQGAAPENNGPENHGPEGTGKAEADKQANSQPTAPLPAYQPGQDFTAKPEYPAQPEYTAQPEHTAQTPVAPAPWAQGPAENATEQIQAQHSAPRTERPNTGAPAQRGTAAPLPAAPAFLWRTEPCAALSHAAVPGPPGRSGG